MRNTAINQLIEEATDNEKIFLLVGDLGYSVVEPFAAQFPDRFLNVGIAEQNMAGIAAGLAKEGFIPFIYSIGNFPTLRCMEQIRYDICYPQLPVKIVAVGGGFAYGSLGVSHHATEEIGMLRTLPNMTVCVPADPIEAKLIISQTVNDNMPCYIRLYKNGEPCLHQSSDIALVKGSPLLLKKGEKTAVFVMGTIASDVLSFLQEHHISAAVYTFPFIKPLNRMALKPLFEQYDKIITMEEHQASCGFGSAVLECMNDLIEQRLLPKTPLIQRIAIQDEFTYICGSHNYLKKLNRLLLQKEFFD